MTARRSSVKPKRNPAPSAEAAASGLPEADPLPMYRLPVVAAAFAAGVLCTTRPARNVLCGILRVALVLAKPALVIGGLLKLREVAELPSSLSSTNNSRPTTLPS